MRQFILDNLKNSVGWRTSEKLVVFSFDDYGVVRLSSKLARKNLCAAGLDMTSRFDQMDAMETKADLEALFSALTSVTDREGRHPVVTAYSVCANPDFERIKCERAYVYEELPKTFADLAATQPGSYNGAWSLWREGVNDGLIRPQFHGREHVNVDLIERKLSRDDSKLDSNIENKSLVALPDEPDCPGVGFTHALAPVDERSVERHGPIIMDGLDLFERIHGFRSSTFTPPAHRLHPNLHSTAVSLGVRGIDKPRFQVMPLNSRPSLRRLNVLGWMSDSEHVSLVRNVVFEPSRDSGAVRNALGQISAAFLWSKPAIISSHRVNFAGHIEPENRRKGIESLRTLLAAIVGRWPDVRFISADELVDKVIATT